MMHADSTLGLCQEYLEFSSWQGRAGEITLKLITATGP